jgi:hypothetical protein
MIGGAGFLVGRSAARHSAMEQQQAAPPPPAAGQAGLVSKLQQLAALEDQDVLTPDEFEAAKQKLLAG